MAELNEKKLVNAAALRDVAKGVYEQVQADIDAVEAQIEEAQVFEPGMGLTMKEVGGVKAGISLDGLTVQEVLAKIFYPHTKPTVTSVNTTPSASNKIFEYGNPQTVTSVSATVGKKSKPITKVELLKGSDILATKEDIANGGPVTFAGLSKVMANGEKFTVKAYAMNEAETAQESSTANSAAFTYVYPYYQGVVGENDEITGALVAGLTKKIEIEGIKTWAYTTDNQRAVFAYPKSYGALAAEKAIFDPNNFDVTGTFTRYEVKVKGLDETEQDYYVYVSGANTNTNFSYKFVM